MSKILDALSQGEVEVPRSALAALLDELAGAKAKLRAPAAPSQPAIRTARLKIRAQSPLLPFDGAHCQAAEEYRIARTRITQHPLVPSMMVVSSAGRGDGKTVTAINLAASLSLKAEGDVLLVDADFRQSAVRSLLGLPAAAGLAQVLSGTSTLESALTRTEQFPNFYILGAGSPPSNPSELLDSSQWRDLAKLLRQSFRYIILDSPPVAAVADYELVQAVCDGTLLVLRPDHTKHSAVAQALKTIPKDRLIGVVMNAVPQWFPFDDGRASYEDADLGLPAFRELM